MQKNIVQPEDRLRRPRFSVQTNSQTHMLPPAPSQVPSKEEERQWSAAFRTSLCYRKLEMPSLVIPWYEIGDTTLAATK
eukprot:55217-Pyramimonas_sp.AAC.2